MSIAIGIPVSRLFDWRTVNSLLYLVNDVRGDVAFITRGKHERPMPIERAREEIAEQVLRDGHEYLLFVDSDATLAPGTLTRLLSRNVPVVSALCFKRKYPVTPACGFRDYSKSAMHHPAPVARVADWLGHYGQLATNDAVVLPTAPAGSLMEVDVTGTHCTLIHRSVLEAMPPPRFERRTHPDAGATGSDWDFCIKARAAGFPIYVDLSVLAGHLEGSHVIGGLDFMAWTIWTRWVTRNVPQSIVEEE